APVPRNAGGHAPGRGGLRRGPFNPEHGFCPVPRLRLADPRRLDCGGPLVRPSARRKARDRGEGGRVGPRFETARRNVGDHRKSELFSPMISCWPFGRRPSAERMVRSEERRVGKEGRCRWSTEREKRACVIVTC